MFDFSRMNNAFMEVSDIDMSYEIAGRFMGDIASCLSDVSKS